MSHISLAMAPNKNTPHVLIFPYPSQGPLNCMMKLAELLAIAGLHVTLINTEDTHRRLCLSSASIPITPLLRFKSIPDGLPNDKPRDVSLLIDVIESLNINSRLLLRDLMLNMKSQDSSDGFPPLTCVIADGFLPFVVDLAEEINLPCLSFRTPSACSIWAYLCIPKLLQNRELPFGEGVDLDELVQGVQGWRVFFGEETYQSFSEQQKMQMIPSSSSWPPWQHIAVERGVSSLTQQKCWNLPRFITSGRKSP